MVEYWNDVEDKKTKIPFQYSNCGAKFINYYYIISIDGPEEIALKKEA